MSNAKTPGASPGVLIALGSPSSYHRGRGWLQVKGFSLALSGGGLLGAAHLGALLYLQEQHVSAMAVAGTSAGGLVASLYALGVDMTRIIGLGEEVTSHPLDYFHVNARGLADEWLRFLGPPASGLINPEAFVAALLGLAPEAKTTADWTMPTVLTSVNLVDLSAYCFTNRPGDLGPPRGTWHIVPDAPLSLAMQATMAMPGLFAAPRWANQLLVDGGVADTLPVDWAAALAPDLVVAIDVASTGPMPAAQIGLADVLSRSEAYATDTLSRLREGAVAHLTIRPDTAGVPFFGLSDYPRLVDAGWDAMKSAWPRLQEALDGGVSSSRDRTR